MTLDETIEHVREVAEKQRKDNDTCIYKQDYGCKGCADYYAKPCNECAEEHEQLAEWLEELQKYWAIGTVEECREAMERQIPKKANRFKKKGEAFYQCGVCGRDIFSDNDKYCAICGQALDWSEEE